MTNLTKKERAVLAVMLALLLLFLLFMNRFPTVRDALDETDAELVDLAVTRLLCGGIFLCLAVYLGHPLFSPRRTRVKGILCSLPALLIAVNNFPLIGLISGSVTLTAPAYRILLLALACIGIGLFEELAFRGVVFPALFGRVLKKLKETEKENARLPAETKAVFLSILLTSAVFGLIHLLNLFSGGSPLGVLLQTGYSFLIGGMCAIVLLKTRTVLFPILVHAVYDFGGLMFRYLCEGSLWDTPTVILTAVLAVLTAVYFLALLFSMKPEEIAALTARDEPPPPDSHDPR